MIPLNDLNPTRRTPILTWALIVLNVLIFLWESSFAEGALMGVFTCISVVPAQAVAAPFALETQLDVLRSMFLHGSWAHLIGNMLYLYLFGDNVEDRFGSVRYLLFYIAAGLAASFAQYAVNPASSIPNVGASGAIAGVLGAYILMFPKARVDVLLGRQVVAMPAFIVLGFWIVLQLVSGVGSIADTAQTETGGVAYMAHVGGFVAGLVLGVLFGGLRRPDRIA